MQTTEIGATPSVPKFDNTPSQELGQEDFLIMLIAQLENQDPLDPQDATEFTAQLAQFSSLDQLVSMRTAIDDLAAEQVTSRSLSVASLVGRDVLVESNEIDVNAKTNPSITIELPGTADVELQLLDSSGRIVARRPYTNLPSGRTEVALDTLGTTVPPGQYSIRLATDPTGPSATSLVRGTVTGASFESGRSTLLLGNVGVSIADLRELTQ